MRLFECARFAPFRAVGLVNAKQFDFHPLRCDCGSVDDDKRSVCPPGQLMKRSRCKLLACPRGTNDKLATIRWRHAIDSLTQLSDRCRPADKRRRLWRKL